MKIIAQYFIACFWLLFAINSYAVEGFQKFMFGMTLEEAKKVQFCAWEKQDIDFRGFMISGNKRASLFKCSTFPYQQRQIEFYLEFIDATLQRIILDISAGEEDNLAALEVFKKQYGFKNGSVQEKGRRQLYSFDDASVEVELYLAPLNLMYLRFYSESYRQLIRQPFLKGLKT